MPEPLITVVRPETYIVVQVVECRQQVDAQEAAKIRRQRSERLTKPKVPPFPPMAVLPPTNCGYLMIEHSVWVVPDSSWAAW